MTSLPPPSGDIEKLIADFEQWQTFPNPETCPVEWSHAVSSHRCVPQLLEHIRALETASASKNLTLRTIAEDADKAVDDWMNEKKECTLNALMNIRATAEQSILIKPSGDLDESVSLLVEKLKQDTDSLFAYIRALEADNKAMRSEIEWAIEVFSDESKGRGLSVYGANGLKRLQAVIPSLLIKP